MWKSNCYERGFTEVKDVERTRQLCLMFEKVLDKNRLEWSRGGGWTERVPNTENPQQLPPSAASSSRGQLEVPRYHSRLLDSNSLCMFKDSLTKEEEEVVLILRDFSETGKRIKKAKR
uniref:Uncharacterized protein n=1 Tax=Solanum lycopersicum TaxID=4081 RepID=A0A494G9G2_SOLLC